MNGAAAVDVAFWWCALKPNDGWWPQPKALSCPALRPITEAERLKIKPLAALSTTKTGPLPEHAFSAIEITPLGLKGQGSVLIERAAVLAIQHIEADRRDGTAAFAQSLATGLYRLAGFKMGEQQALNRPWVPTPQGEGAESRAHELLGRDCHLLHGNQGPAAAVVGPTATGALLRLGRGGLPADAQGYGGD